MSNTPEQLAERLDTDALWHERRCNETIAKDCRDAAAELRRLAAENAALRAEAMRFREDALNENAARKAIEAALAERQGEAVPTVAHVAIKDARDYLNTNDKGFWVVGWNECVDAMRKKSAPRPAPAQQPLTDERIKAIVQEAAKGAAFRRDGTTSTRIARAIEAAHGIGGEKPDPPHGWSAERYAKYQADVRDAGDKP